MASRRKRSETEEDDFEDISLGSNTANSMKSASSREDSWIFDRISNRRLRGQGNESKMQRRRHNIDDDSHVDLQAHSGYAPAPASGNIPSPVSDQVNSSDPMKASTLPVNTPSSSEQCPPLPMLVDVAVPPQVTSDAESSSHVPINPHLTPHSPMDGVHHVFPGVGQASQLSFGQDAHTSVFVIPYLAYPFARVFSGLEHADLGVQCSFDQESRQFRASGRPELVANAIQLMRDYVKRIQSLVVSRRVNFPASQRHRVLEERFRKWLLHNHFSLVLIPPDMRNEVNIYGHRDSVNAAQSHVLALLGSQETPLVSTPTNTDTPVPDPTIVAPSQAPASSTVPNASTAPAAPQASEASVSTPTGVHSSSQSAQPASQAHAERANNPSIDGSARTAIWPPRPSVARTTFDGRPSQAASQTSQSADDIEPPQAPLVAPSVNAARPQADSVPRVQAAPSFMDVPTPSELPAAMSTFHQASTPAAVQPGPIRPTPLAPGSLADLYQHIRNVARPPAAPIRQDTYNPSVHDSTLSRASTPDFSDRMSGISGSGGSPTINRSNGDGVPSTGSNPSPQEEVEAEADIPMQEASQQRATPLPPSVNEDVSQQATSAVTREEIKQIYDRQEQIIQLLTNLSLNPPAPQQAPAPAPPAPRRRKKNAERANAAAQAVAMPKQPAQTRDNEDVLLQGIARDAIMTLLERTSCWDPFPDSKIPSREEVKAYEKMQFGGPTKDNWRVDPLSGGASKWNKEAGSQFAKMLIEHRSIHPSQESDILTWFRRYHNQTTKFYYKAIHLDADGGARARAKRARDASRADRRKTSSEQRLKACGRHSELAHVYPVLSAAGPGADLHSDDESDHESDRRVYRIIPKEWRSEMALKFLRLLDLLHLGSKFQGERIAPGNWPRERRPTPGSGSGTGDPLKGLPVNFYDATWLASQTEERKRALNIQPSVSLEVPLSLRAYAAKVLGVLRTNCTGLHGWQDLQISQTELDQLDVYLLTGRRPSASYGRG